MFKSKKVQFSALHSFPLPRPLPQIHVSMESWCVPVLLGPLVWAGLPGLAGVPGFIILDKRHSSPEIASNNKLV